MGSFFLELSLLGAIIIAITAFSAVIVQFFGQNIFGRKKKGIFINHSEAIQANWKQVGGKKK